MKTSTVVILAASSFILGWSISKIGKPNIKLLPFTSNENNGLATLNFEVGGRSWDVILSKDGVGSPLGSIGDITWNVNMNSLKNITISAYNEKTKRASAIYTQLPTGMSLIKTK